MFWFRHHQAAFMRFAIVLWVLAFGMAASQGCLAQPSHNPATPHVSLNTLQHDDGHDTHTIGCLQYCADTAIAISPSLHLPVLDLASWAFLLLVPTLLLYPTKPSAFAFLALQRPAPARPPARLTFVRSND